MTSSIFLDETADIAGEILFHPLSKYAQGYSLLPGPVRCEWRDAPEEAKREALLEDVHPTLLLHDSFRSPSLFPGMISTHPLTEYPQQEGGFYPTGLTFIIAGQQRIWTRERY